MFDYIPEKHDLDSRYVNFKEVKRTKSRAYKFAVWSSCLGGHNFFLGQWLVGTLHLLFTASLAPIYVFVDWQTLLATIIIDVMWCYYGVKKIAVSDEDDPMYSGHTPKWFFPLMVIHMNTIIWDVDFWARKRKKAKKESSSKEDAQG